MQDATVPPFPIQNKILYNKYKKKKKTNKQVEGTKGYTFDYNESKIKVLDCYADMKDNKTKMK
jgi:hypothetical protein